MKGIMSYKLKILIVDDLPANLSALEQLLEDIDVDIIKAADGNDAVGKAFENKFDLILMDVQMPGMNGFEAVNLIKKEEKNKYIPIIFLTAAYLDEISKIEGIQAGAVDYITKPISEEILLGKVKLFLDMQKDKKELELAEHNLKEKIDELGQANIKLEKSNTKLEKANQIIKIKAEDIKNAAKTKSRFLTLMSHEIRTPLNAIMGSARLLKESKSSEEKKQYSEIIETSGNLLLGIINNVLDYSRIEAHMLKILSNQFSLDNIVRRMKDLLENIAESKKLHFDVQTNSDLSQVIVGDDIRLQQIILNLCNNAIKYTKKGSVVLKIEVQNETDTNIKYKISIIDTGIGISEEDIKHLFKPFSQFDSVVNKDVEGTGLGLSIVKATVDLMGGKVGVESEPDVGSTFWFEMEFQKKKLEMEDRRISASQRKKYVLTKNKLKILIADDYKFSSIILKNILKKSGINSIDIAENGREAVDLFKRKNYDIIFMDCNMPELNGFKATSEIRKLNKNKKYTYIIALSADIMTENKEACINTGMDYFIVKPFSPDIINDTIREILLIKKISNK